MSKKSSSKATAKESIVNLKDTPSSQSDKHPPWSSWEFSTEGAFYYRARKGVNDEWEYEYGYPSSDSLDSPAKETSGTTAKYLHRPPIKYPKEDLKVIYAERLKPTYISAVAGLLAPHVSVTGAESGNPADEHSNMPSTEHGRISSSQKENSGTNLKTEGESGAGGERNSDSVQNKRPAEEKNAPKRVEKIEKTKMKEKKDKKDKKDKKEKKDRKEKEKKSKPRKPVSKIDRVAQWRDSVNTVMLEGQIEMEYRGDISETQAENES
ncbi:uncharacterized protein BP5553_03056 [Venustampulla echinocandica]|uniref:Uncharacterized protein n=1 Tax=Venustampulla echinocandica TaxID=2656787 RepID=A0A370TT55_9HELO|nr:uncharacterized protein BP5553_03056 [Venustampulla echinocandica]RDL38716.1 hypothetical protein BP5553_03056 [Venustampulla echinocandica]